MLDYWGEKCEDYHPECYCCQAWKLFEKLGVAPTFEETKVEVSKARLMCMNACTKLALEGKQACK